jgi:hypothetical protein
MLQNPSVENPEVFMPWVLLGALSVVMRSAAEGTISEADQRSERWANASVDPIRREAAGILIRSERIWNSEMLGSLRLQKAAVDGYEELDPESVPSLLDESRGVGMVANALVYDGEARIFRWFDGMHQKLRQVRAQETSYDYLVQVTREMLNTYIVVFYGQNEDDGDYLCGSDYFPMHIR